MSEIRKWNSKSQRECEIDFTREIVADVDKHGGPVISSPTETLLVAKQSRKITVEDASRALQGIYDVTEEE